MAVLRRDKQSLLGELLRSEGDTLLDLALWGRVWLVLGLFLAAIVGAYQVPHTYTIDVGSPSDEAYVRNFHARVKDSEPTYRWSDVYGYVAFPGLGGLRPFTATLTFDLARSAPLSVFINGELMMSGVYPAGWQTAVLRVDQRHPQALISRDTLIEFRSEDYRTEDAPAEPKGVKVASVQVEQDAAGGAIVPAVAPVLWVMLALLLVYFLVGRALSGYATLDRSRSWALRATAVAGVALVVAIALDHIAVGASAGHIAVTLLTVFILAVVVELVLRRWFSALSASQSRVLALVFALAFLLRYGGMALPQSVIIDMPYHMKWLNTLLAGDWRALYYPGGLSAVPPEWGIDLLIPKSPLFYFAFASLSFIPFELATSVKWLICLLDSSMVMAVCWLLLRIQLYRWAAILGAALYAVMPLAFRAFSYGILPTIFAQWLAVLLLAAVVAMDTRRWGITAWVGIVALATLVFLSFPTVAVFVSIVLIGYALVLLISRREGGATTAARLGVALLAAWLLAVVAYYGLYISPVLASAQALLAPREGQASTVQWPGGFGDLIAWTADYVVTLLPVLLAGVGFLLLMARRGTLTQMRALWLVALWASIGSLFFLANYRVDMIGKHLFFIMVPVAIAGGVTLFSLGRRGRWAALLAALSFALVGWQGLAFWVERLVRASS